MKFRGAQVSIAIVCLILGIMMAVQFRTTEQSPNYLSTDRWKELTVQMDNLSQERDALAEEVISLRDKMKKITASGQGDAIQVVNEELARANMAAGLVPVKGPGIILTLNDCARPLQKGEDPSMYVIHDEDLLKVVNELWSSGAEAISVNEQRLVATSEIRCAGTTILVNITKIGPPFVIKAIGDPDVLESGLRIPGGWLATLELWGIQDQIKKMDMIEVPAYKGALRFQFAQPNSN